MTAPDLEHPAVRRGRAARQTERLARAMDAPAVLRCVFSGIVDLHEKLLSVLASRPALPRRLLNHWDNLDGSIERGYAGRSLWNWDELPTRGRYLPEAKVWSHEIDFWGGDLASARGKLDYVQRLGADVVYLNPIHLAWTNHKYDALDYKALSPEFGSGADLDALIADTHAHGMKFVLDGVFNHMGRNSAIFREAASGPGSRYRDWFVWGPQYPGGARVWMDAENLPELNLENPAVRDYVYARPDSVVQSYLARGVDGWRLDVASDIGFAYLGELTRAAHQRRPGSLVVGEIANYPQQWFPHVDAVMDFTLREIILRTA